MVVVKDSCGDIPVTGDEAKGIFGDLDCGCAGYAPGTRTGLERSTACALVHEGVKVGCFKNRNKRELKLSSLHTRNEKQVQK